MAAIKDTVNKLIHHLRKSNPIDKIIHQNKSCQNDANEMLHVIQWNCQRMKEIKNKTE